MVTTYGFDSAIPVWLLCRIAKRNALDLRWPVAVCVLIAVLLAFLTFSWNPKMVAGRRRNFHGWFDLRILVEWFLLTWLPKLALTLGIRLALVWRERCRNGDQISDSSATIPTLPAA
jgi:hypothetical protein